MPTWVGNLYVWSKVDLPDPATYYGGFKEARVLSYGQINRALSDDRGNYEGADFSFDVADTDRLIRGLMAGQSTKYGIRNRNVTIRMISDADRRLLRTPRTIARGLTKNIIPTSPAQARFECVDFVTSKFGTNVDVPMPQRVFKTDFPGAPVNTRDLAVPIVYGRVTDEVSTGAPPIPDVHTPEGSYIAADHTAYDAGFGPMPYSDAHIVTGVTAVADAPGSGSLADSVPNAEWGVWVTAVDALGRETDPHIYYAGGPAIGRGSWAVGPTPGIVVDGTQSITVTWSASAGAVKYRAYIGWYYFGANWRQRIETTALTCTFTTGPGMSDPFQEIPSTPDNITPGATLTVEPFYYYAIIAVMPDGLTAPSTIVKFNEVFGQSGPYMRPLRIRWIPVPGALEYRIVRRPLPIFAESHYDRMWTVPITQTDAKGPWWDDDLRDTGVTYLEDGLQVPRGVVPTLYLGPTLDDSGFSWETFAIAGHAIAGVDSWFLNGERVDPGTAGITWLLPGQPGYNSYFAASGTDGKYRDIGLGRYSLIYVRGPDGAAGAGAAAGDSPDKDAEGVSKITINMRGITEVSDGTGAVITDLHQIYKHFIINWGFQPVYLKGPWQGPPTWAPDAPTLSKVDTASFDKASEIAHYRVPGGYIGAGIIGVNGEREPLRDWMARFNLSAGVDSGFNRNSQFFVSMIDDRFSALEHSLEFTQLQDIVAESFSVVPQVDKHFNVHPFMYLRNWREGKWDIEGKDVRDQMSIDGYLIELTAQALELWFVRDATTAMSVMNWRLLLAKDPPVLAVFKTPLVGFNTDLGDLILLTHVDGEGPQGWSRRAVRIVRHALNPNDFSITMECHDVQRVFAGNFVLGNETWGVTWTTAAPDQKLYGFLSDETTGQFSTGTEGKRLR